MWRGYTEALGKKLRGYRNDCRGSAGSNQHQEERDLTTGFPARKAFEEGNLGPLSNWRQINRHGASLKLLAI